jgi:hypothetical protein
MGERVRFVIPGPLDAAPLGRFVSPASGSIQFSPDPAGTSLIGVARVAGFPSLGTFRLETVARHGGSSTVYRHDFTIVGGGDSGGLVISLFTADRPGGARVLAHLDSGRLVQGNSPRA